MIAISYEREEGTNLYRVRAMGQTIVVRQSCLKEKLGMNIRCSIGYQEVTCDQATEIGFLIPANTKKA